MRLYWMVTCPPLLSSSLADWNADMSHMIAADVRSCMPYMNLRKDYRSYRRVDVEAQWYLEVQKKNATVTSLGWLLVLANLA